MTRHQIRGWMLFILAHAIIVVSVTPVEANPTAAYAAKFFGEYLLGKAIDPLWNSATGSPNVRELDTRLRVFEAALQQVDKRLATQVSELRRELGTKVTRKEVRDLVHKILEELEDKIRELESRVDRLDERVSELEELFGYIPTIPPAPLLPSSSETGKPVAHPLIVDWVKLLVKSEANRTQLERLKQFYTEDAPEVKECLEEKQVIINLIDDLHVTVKRDVAKRLPERNSMLRTLKPAHPNVRKFDDELASLTWLIAVTRPIAEGPNKGRLGVPADLLGPRSSDILIAFELGGADVSTTVPLIREVLKVQQTTEYSAYVTPAAHELELFTGSMHDYYAQAQALVRRDVPDAMVKAARIESSFRRIANEKTTLAPEFVSVQMAKSSHMDDLEALSAKSNEILAKALRAYVRALKIVRANSPRAIAFRDYVLFPLLRLEGELWCNDWDDDLERKTTWDRIANSVLKPKSLYTLELERAAQLRVFLSSNARRLVTSAENDKVITVWDLMSGRKLFSAWGERAPFITNDSRMMVTSGRDDDIVVRDLATGETLRTIRNASFVYSKVVGSRGTLLATGHYDGVRIWDLRTGKARGHDLGGYDGVNTLLLSPDGSRVIASASMGINITRKVITKALDWNGRVLYSLPNAYSPVVSADGTRLAVATLDKRIDVLDLKTGRPLHSMETDSVPVSISEGNSTLITKVWGGATPSSIQVWNISREQMVATVQERTLKMDVECVAATKDGQILIFGGDATSSRAKGFSSRGVVKVYDLASGTTLLEMSSSSNSGVSNLRLGSNEKMVVAGGWLTKRGTVDVWYFPWGLGALAPEK